MDAGQRYEKWKADNLKGLFTRWWAEAELEHMQPDYEHPVLVADAWGVLDITGAPLLCTNWQVKKPDGWWKTDGEAWPYERCKKPAGYLTDHEGVGLCYMCKGRQGVGKAKGAILLAMAYADEMPGVTPWEALLSQCRLLANQVAWLRQRVYEAEAQYGPAGLKPGGEGFDWVQMLEQRGERLAKVAKLCIDAGIAERLVRQVEVEAEAMMKAAVAGMDAAGLTDDQRHLLLDRMSTELLALESGSTS